MSLSRPFAIVASTLALVGLGMVAGPAWAASADTVGLDPSDAGTLAFIDPVTGVDITSIPTAGIFPSHPGDRLSNVSGIAFNPVDGLLYALDYYCEIITIDTTSGISTPVVTAPGGAGGAPDCEGLAITADGDILVGMRTTVKKLDVLGQTYVALPGAPTFTYVTWLAFEPVSSTVYVGDYIASLMNALTMNPDGSSTTSLGLDTNFLSSVAFDAAGNSMGGYWGDGFFSGLTTAFPAPMTSSSASPIVNAYWIAATAGEGSDPGPTPSTNDASSTLAATGIDAFSLLASGLAFALAGVAVALVAARRRNAR